MEQINIYNVYEKENLLKILNQYEKIGDIPHSVRFHLIEIFIPLGVVIKRYKTKPPQWDLCNDGRYALLLFYLMDAHMKVIKDGDYEIKELDFFTERVFETMNKRPTFSMNEIEEIREKLIKMKW